MNPTETAEDNLNFSLPEPLSDRFDAMMWIPHCRMEHELKVKTQIEMRDLLESVQIIWSEKDLVNMWDYTSHIPIPDEYHTLISLACIIISFCLYAQDYDATSLGMSKKRALCATCNHG